jgi:TRAP-type C4-dicarboxylate transport system substrate-binding protein
MGGPRRLLRGGLLVAALALAGVLLSACGGGQADKAGGVPKPVVLRLGDPYGPLPGDDTRYFVAQVERLSGGSLRLRHVPEVAGSAGGPGEREWRTAKLVRAGKVDLATLAARTWDLEGVTSLEALQAPMLVTSQAVLNRIVTGQIGDQMLRGLTKIGVTGLVLLPQALYHPFGLGGS